MTHLKLALDWTPNMNHIGFFVAQRKGFYEASNLQVELIDPTDDNYKTTPAKKVELGMVDFALCPTESIISYRTKDKSFPLIGLAALLQTDLSAIAVRSNRGIHSPKNLDDKIYSSYKAKYEDGIVKEMIKNDGGTGNLKITYPDKLGIWNTLLTGAADATWIFMNWEGVEAENLEEELTYFKLRDYHIPYSYSPVVAADALRIAQNKATYSLFLEATKKGFLYCKTNSEECINILKDFIPEHDKHINLDKSFQRTVPHFGNDDNWGKIKASGLSEFVRWIQQKKLEESKIDASDLFTQECITW